MLPQPRPRLKNVPYKNQSLQDILLTCAVGVEVLDIKRVAGDKHNTRLVVTIDKGKLHPPEDRFENHDIGRLRPICGRGHYQRY